MVAAELEACCEEHCKVGLGISKSIELDKFLGEVLDIFILLKGVVEILTEEVDVDEELKLELYAARKWCRKD
ncbi:unnamed protein product [Victoria cruziana]